MMSFYCSERLRRREVSQEILPGIDKIGEFAIRWSISVIEIGLKGYAPAWQKGVLSRKRSRLVPAVMQVTKVAAWRPIREAKGEE